MSNPSRSYFKALVLSAVFVMICCFFMINFSEESDAETEGTCGTNLTWSYNTLSRTLTISGTGTTMQDYTLIDTRWGGNTDIQTVIMPDTLEHIGNCAFMGRTGISSITLPDNLTSIGDWAFMNCSNLDTVTVNSTLTTIGANAFDGCSDLTSFTMPSTVTTIGGAAFYGCTSLGTITIPENVTSLGTNAFSGCTNLTSVDINGSIVTISSSSFYDCTNLESVTLPQTVKSIDNYAFYNCNSLESITIPGSVTSIGMEAFKECTSLSTVRTICTNPLGIATGSTDNGYVGYYASEIVLIHNYTGIENWSDDGKDCALTILCTNDTTHRVTVHPQIEAIVMAAPTESNKGATGYSYNYMYEGYPYAGNKIVEDIDRLGSGETWTDFAGIVIPGGVATNITDAVDKAKVLGINLKVMAMTQIGEVAVTLNTDAVDSMTYTSVSLKVDVGSISEMSGTGMPIAFTLTGASVNAGNVTVSMPLNAAISSGSTVKVYCGEQDLNATYKDGRLSFGHNGLSSYKAIVESQASPSGGDTPSGDDPADDSGKTPSDTGPSSGGGNSFLWIITLILGFAAGVGSVFLIMYLKAKKG